MRTGKEVQTDIINLLSDSALAAAVSGGIYRNGCRPRGSGLEDIVVTFTAGLASEVETGVVTVNIFVPDITPYADNGVRVEDMKRTAQLERAAQNWVDTLKAGVSNYLFSLQSTISTSIDSIAGEHYIVVRLAYKYFGN